MERRQALRARSVLKAEARYNNGLMHIPCVVRDFSDMGAKLDFGGHVTVPNRFELYVDKHQRSRRAVVRWAKGNEVGIAFDDAPDAVAAAPITERLSELEAQMSTIRPMLSRKGRRMATLFPQVNPPARYRRPT